MTLLNNKKILMIISHYYPLLGGAEVQAQRLAINLAKKGIKVFVLTRRFEKLPEYEEIEGISVYRKIKTIDVPLLWGACFVVSVFLFLIKRRKDYDIIHCHIIQEYQTIIALLLKYMFNKKVIVKMSSSGETSDLKMVRKAKFGRIFLRWIRNVDIVVSLCKRASSELLENGFSEEKLVEIPNGIDLNDFPEGTLRRQRNHTITFIGRLDSYKGVEYLLAGFKELLHESDNVRLNIVGNGPDENLLMKKAKDLGIQNSVVFKGRQQDIVDELYCTTIFVLPSLSEGMSNVLLEAMACGLPVVATDVGGNSDVITDRHNGLLVSARDPAGLCAAMRELIENEDLSQRLGKEARKTIERNYSINLIVDKYTKLYGRL
jgi:glycosyltransferase involved in cell wall biosynthesis